MNFSLDQFLQRESPGPGQDPDKKLPLLAFFCFVTSLPWASCLSASANQRRAERGLTNERAGVCGDPGPCDGNTLECLDRANQFLHHSACLLPWPGEGKYVTRHVNKNISANISRQTHSDISYLWRMIGWPFGWSPTIIANTPLPPCIIFHMGK